MSERDDRKRKNELFRLEIGSVNIDGLHQSTVDDVPLERKRDTTLK